MTIRTTIQAIDQLTTPAAIENRRDIIDSIHATSMSLSVQACDYMTLVNELRHDPAFSMSQLDSTYALAMRLHRMAGDLETMERTLRRSGFADSQFSIPGQK